MTALTDAGAGGHALTARRAEDALGAGPTEASAAIIPAALAFTLGHAGLALACARLAGLPRWAEPAEAPAAVRPAGLSVAAGGAERAALRGLVRDTLGADVGAACPLVGAGEVAVTEGAEGAAAVDTGGGVDALALEVAVGRLVALAAGASAPVIAAGLLCALGLTAALGLGGPAASLGAAEVSCGAGISIVAGAVDRRRALNTAPLDAGEDQARPGGLKPSAPLVL